MDKINNLVIKEKKKKNQLTSVIHRFFLFYQEKNSKKGIYILNICTHTAFSIHARTHFFFFFSFLVHCTVSTFIYNTYWARPFFLRKEYSLVQQYRRDRHRGTLIKKKK